MNIEELIHTDKPGSRPSDVFLLAKSIVKYWSYYFGSRAFPGNQKFHVVYTSIDHQIPFQPDPAGEYWIVNFRFVPALLEMQKRMPAVLFNRIMKAYVDIAREGTSAFREVPTIMPRFSGCGNHTAPAATSLLKPVNCSPSLHTATPFFAYNVIARYLPEREPELRYHLGRVISTVIKTKHHALIDVAFGMFLARQTVENKIGLDFNSLEAYFIKEQKAIDNIPYEHVYRMYREIAELTNSWNSELSCLSKVMKLYFQELGLPLVKREESGCFFDLEKKELVTCPELKVGRGLV